MHKLKGLERGARHAIEKQHNTQVLSEARNDAKSAEKESGQNLQQIDGMIQQAEKTASADPAHAAGAQASLAELHKTREAVAAQQSKIVDAHGTISNASNVIDGKRHDARREGKAAGEVAQQEGAKLGPLMAQAQKQFQDFNQAASGGPDAQNMLLSQSTAQKGAAATSQAVPTSAPAAGAPKP